MPDQNHGQQGQDGEEEGIGKEGTKSQHLHEKTRQNGSHNLRRHRGSVVHASVLAHIRNMTHLYNHRQGINIDEGPTHPHNSKRQIDQG